MADDQQIAHSRAEPTAQSGSSSGIVVSIGVFAVEALLMAGAAANQTPITYALAAHAVVVAALAVRCRSVVRAGGDAGTAALFTVGVAVAGPFGALGGMVIDWLSVQGQEHRDRLQRWYERIALSVDTDDVTKLSDHIVAGRSMDLGSAAPPSFMRLIDHGSVHEKQAVLGLIARQFHPRYLAALQTALVSDEPVIRVQAAAVAARVRVGLAEEVERRLADLAEAKKPNEMIAICDELERCAASGLLEDRQRQRVEVEASQSRTRAVEMMRAASGPVLAGSSVASHHVLADNAARTTFEDVLLSEGRYAEFRRLRRAFAFPVKGQWRFRVGRWPRRRRSGARVAEGGVSS